LVDPLKTVEPNVLKMGAYLNDVITANITVASLSRFKENIQELEPKLLDIELPTLKIYQRTEDKREAEEAAKRIRVS